MIDFDPTSPGFPLFKRIKAVAQSITNLFLFSMKVLNALKINIDLGVTWLVLYAACG